MRTSSTSRYVAGILLALFACGAFACCDSDCVEGWHGCSLAADDAVLSHGYAGELNCTATHADAETDQTAYLTRLAIADVFRPPNAIS